MKDCFYGSFEKLTPGDWEKARASMQFKQVLLGAEDDEAKTCRGQVTWATAEIGASTGVRWMWRESEPNTVLIEDPMKVEANFVLVDDDGRPFGPSMQLLELNRAISQFAWRDRVKAFCTDLKAGRAR